ncbi:MAG: ECF transporter S component [Oscillospiraceae bacterium]|nr:ECF transporter S component [Oscillospiraceae bacterium]
MQTLSHSRSQELTKKIAVLAMLSAVAFIFSLIRIPTVAFLRYEPKDVIMVIGGFLYGPMAVIPMSIVVSFVEMLTVSDTGPIGMIMNIIATCSYACTASFIYKRWRTFQGAAVGLILGIVVNVPVMLLWNYFVTPFHMGVAREVVVQMLVPVFLPFNVVKGSLTAAMTMILYKPIRSALVKSRLMPVSASSVARSSKVSFGVVLVSAFVIITCAVVVLSWQGVI